MMMVFFGFAVVFGVLFLQPYVFYPMSLLLLPRKPVHRDSARPTPTATLVFCAYNEAASVPSKIANLRAIRAVAPEIKFACYVDQSSDDTLALLQQHADLIDVIAAPERTGKAAGMGMLAAAATTEIMIFTDANVLVEPESAPRILRYFQDPEVGCVCGTLIYTNPQDSATAGTNSAYWRLEELIKKREARTGSTMGADGSIFASRLAYYPEVPTHLLDDFIVSMSVVFAGLRMISAPDVLAYERSAVASEDEFRRKRRIACRAYSSHRYLRPQLARMSLTNRYKYISHRFLRWYGAATGAMSILFCLAFIGLAWSWVAVGALCASGAAIFWLSSKIRAPGLSHVYETIRAIYAAGLGVYDAWRGRTYQRWQPIQTR
ncbi:MAG TPA: glycosyltransferase [Caulobacteraceae bacterium]|jgi:cellulose synthase/poly-beta-1,6-N-acetylglucosamine synthase-like glycosyltransferase